MNLQSWREFLNDLEGKLKTRGLNENEINAAIYLSHWLNFFDKCVFPSEKSDVKILYLTKENKEDDVAGYVDPKQKGGECYVIYVKNLYQEVVKAWRVTYLLSKEGKKFFLPSDKSQRRQASPEEVVISIAAHEVRHRMQYHHLIRPFSPKAEKKERDPLLKYLVGFVPYLFEEVKRDMKKEGKSLRQIWRRINRREFDVRVIQELVIQKIRQCPTPRAIASLLWTEPFKGD